MLSCSRPHFSEFEVMRDYLTQKQVGFIMDSKKFFACDWEEEIQQVQKLTVAGKVPLNGEEEVLNAIDHILGN